MVPCSHMDGRLPAIISVNRFVSSIFSCSILLLGNVHISMAYTQRGPYPATALQVGMVPYGGARAPLPHPRGSLEGFWLCLEAAGTVSSSMSHLQKKHCKIRGLLVGWAGRGHARPCRSQRLGPAHEHGHERCLQQGTSPGESAWRHFDAPGNPRVPWSSGWFHQPTGGVS